MNALNLLLQDGRIYCRECLCQIPATFLACPACHGFVRERGHWVVPAPGGKPPRAPDSEQPLLFENGCRFYPLRDAAQTGGGRDTPSFRTGTGGSI